MSHRPATGGVIAAACLVVGLTSLVAPSAVASQPSVPAPSPSAMVSAIPSTKTPAVDDGEVRAIAKVGATMVIGGNFTKVNGLGRSRIATFDAATGTLSGFTLAVNGQVNAIVPGPNDHSLYIGGNFTQVGSTARQFLALVDLAGAGSVVTSWVPPAFNFGFVNDLVKRGTRLYAAGTFTKAGGIAHGGLVSLSDATGALDPFMGVQFSGRHNDSGSGAQGWIGPVALDATADGTKMVVIGNFKRADGLLRDQVAQLDLSGSRAVVRTDWATSRYSPYCFNWAFDSYVRGVSYAPDGAYFVVAATGGGVTNTLCDAAARFETNTASTSAQPTWVDETGGDTAWGVSVTNNVVYVGGHQRWANNPFGVDAAKPGAVPRPGLMALDPISGRPLTWNPGRNPPGKAVYAVLATADGLYIGSDTNWIGNFKYKRPRIAFFPYAGGGTLASTTTGSLPGTVYVGGSTSTTTADELRKVAVTTTAASSPQLVTGSGVAWGQTRGAFMVGNTVFFGKSDSSLYRMTFNGTTFGPQTKIDPYHDPAWMNVSDNLGGTFDGATPTLYGQLPNVTGMTYAEGKLYYTLARDATLRWRWFSPDSGIVDERTNTVSSSVSFADANGMFVYGGRLYYVTASNGNLWSISFSSGVVSGSATLVSGPIKDGINWRNRSLFLYNG
jgi:hypothetical protein